MDFKSEVRSFLRWTNIPKTRFGRLAMHDPNFIDRLNNTEPRPKTIERVRIFMNNWRD